MSTVRQPGRMRHFCGCDGRHVAIEMMPQRHWMPAATIFTFQGADQS
jgi:hypothetical protein